MPERQSIDKLQLCSETFNEGMQELSERDIPYYSDEATALAARAIQDIYPDFVKLVNQTVSVEAMQAVSLSSENSYEFNNTINVAGVLRTIRVQQRLTNDYIGDSSFSINSFDLCAILVPEYENPSHEEILLGDQLYVPFAAITDLSQKV